MFIRQGIQLFFKRGQLVLQNQFKMCSFINQPKPLQMKDINYQQVNKQNEQNQQINESNKQADLATFTKENSIINADKNMVYCHALPNDWNEKKLKEYFDPNGNCITEIKLLKNRIGGYTGRALIKFKNSKICNDYLQKYGDSFIESTDVLQRIIMKPFELKTKKTRLQFEKTMKEVYLANLPYEVTSDEIYALGQDFGEVLYIDMPLSFDGQKNKGYCIVKFSKAEEASRFQRYFEDETIYGRKIRQTQIDRNLTFIKSKAQIYYYEFDTQKKRNERLSNKIVKEDHTIKNANIKANKDLYKKLMSENNTI